MEIVKKIAKESFEGILSGNKTFEARIEDDCEFNEGDILVLKEIDSGKEFTGREIRKKIGYIVRSKDQKYWDEEQVNNFGVAILSLLDLNGNTERRELLSWEVYEITSSEILQEVKFRGRIRKFALINGFNVMVENVSQDDKENSVRFAVLNEEDAKRVIDFIKEIFPKANVRKILENVENPVLSKLKVNIAERYSLD